MEGAKRPCFFKEISVDGCFDGRDYRMVARVKHGTAGQTIVTDSELYTIALKIAEKFELRGIFNIQLMYHNEKPMVLEVNARPAGGFGMSLLAGVELVAPQLFGLPATHDVDLVPRFEQTVVSTTTYCSTPPLPVGRRKVGIERM